MKLVEDGMEKKKKPLEQTNRKYRNIESNMQIYIAKIY